MCPLLSQVQQGGAVVDIIRMQQLQTPPQWQFLFHTGAEGSGQSCVKMHSKLQVTIFQ